MEETDLPLLNHYALCCEENDVYLEWIVEEEILKENKNEKDKG